jgi:hypothetical protein
MKKDRVKLNDEECRELTPGALYFNMGYPQPGINLPHITTLVYLGKEISDGCDGEAPHALYVFQRADSYHALGDWSELPEERVRGTSFETLVGFPGRNRDRRVRFSRPHPSLATSAAAHRRRVELGASGAPAASDPEMVINMAEFGQWRYTVDRTATADAYAREAAGGAQKCTCTGCRNFVVARDEILPARFVEFLNTLGVDSTKDAEVYHSGRIAPGCHHYGGWYHFIGTLDSTGDFAPVDFGNGFTAWLCAAHAPRISTMSDRSVVQVEFSTNRAPWVLDSSELD